MATKKTDTSDTPKTVKARVLLDCQFGKCNQVVEVDVKELAGAVGMLDPDPSAVAYAETL